MIRKRKIAGRIGAGLMTLIFLLSAAVQLNDPDGLVWVAIYLVPAGFSAAAAFGRVTVWAFPIALACVAGWAYEMPGWSFETLALLKEPKMSTNDVERAREAFGLLIAGIWLAVLGVVWYVRKSRHADAAEGAEEGYR